ncbi:MAG: hypothetical protein LBF91_09745 [Azoarcus sp.]|jgi:hypothetical protein|nr:hypothetical protein [Azoarcus sp.]
MSRDLPDIFAGKDNSNESSEMLLLLRVKRSLSPRQLARQLVVYIMQIIDFISQDSHVAKYDFSPAETLLYRGLGKPNRFSRIKLLPMT